MIMYVILLQVLLGSSGLLFIIGALNADIVLIFIAFFGISAYYTIRENQK